MPQVATKITKAILTSNQTIENGNSIRIHSILISNKSGSNIGVQGTDNDGNALFDIAVPAQSSVEFSPVWIADNGLILLTKGSANVIAHVAHSAAGV